MEVGRGARKCYTLAERVVDNALRVCGWSYLACCKVDSESSGDRCAANIRNLCVSQCCRACNANLQNASEVLKLCIAALAVAIHCSNTACKSAVACVSLLRCKEYLTRSCCRVGDAVRCCECSWNGEAGNCGILANGDCVRLNAVYRNFVATAPIERVALASLLAELRTRLLQRDGNLGYATNVYAEIFSCIGCAGKAYEHRCNYKE